MTRRFFIGSCASFGAFGGLRLSAHPLFVPSGKPRLSFGVLSDVHIRARAGTENCRQGCAYFRHALEWFRAQGVDGVMIAGDIADNGFVEQFQAFADTWFEVFPGDRAPDGRKVEKLFVFGNHDWEGCHSTDHKQPNFMKREFAKYWERFLHEPYEPIYMKKINGYPFIGQHWDRQGWFARCKFERIVPFMAEHGKSLDPKLPFFYFQHPHPKDTCYGSWAGGHDTGIVTRELSAYPNAIAFSGHSHLSLSDERTIWQGAFTSVGAGAMTYTGTPGEFSGIGGCENDRRGTWDANARKLMPVVDTRSCSHGMLWRVYDDCIVAKRREFVGAEAMELGPDWVMPLPSAESRPYAFAERARKVSAPEFASGAILSVCRTAVKNRGGKNPKNAAESIASIDGKGYEITVPAAVGRDGSRAMHYEVVAESGGKQVRKRVLAESFNRAPSRKLAQVPTKCRFADGELSGGQIVFRAIPVNSYGRKGRALECSVQSEMSS